MNQRRCVSKKPHTSDGAMRYDKIRERSSFGRSSICVRGISFVDKEPTGGNNARGALMMMLSQEQKSSSKVGSE